MNLCKTPGSADMAQGGSRSIWKSTCSSWSFPARKLFDRAASATLCPLKAWMWLGTGRASALNSSVMVGGGGLPRPHLRDAPPVSLHTGSPLDWNSGLELLFQKESQCLQWSTPRPASLCSHSPRIPLRCLCSKPPLTD